MMLPNEARTRKRLIDPALAKAGWNLQDPAQVGIEIPVDGYDAESWNGITDYCLYQPNGEVIAVVEAKRQSRDPNVAREQAHYYITEIAKHQSFQPFAFLTNGLDTYFWDEENASPRLGVPPKSPDHQDVNTLRILTQTHQEARSPTMSGDVWHYRHPPETSASSFAPPQRSDTGADRFLHTSAF